MSMTPRRRKTLFVVGSLAVAAAGFFGARAYQRSKTPDVTTVEPRRGSVVEVVSETGKVSAAEDLTLSFKRSGRVSAILVKEGEAVKKGQPLMRLNTSDLSIQRREALAALVSAEARYAQAAAGATQGDLKVLGASVHNAEIYLETARRSLLDAQASYDASLGKAYADLDGQMETVFQKASSMMQTLKSDVYESSVQLRRDILSADDGLQSMALSAYGTALGALASMETGIAAYRASVTEADRDSRSTAFIGDAMTIRDAAQLSNALMQGSSPIIGTTQTAFDARKTNVRAAWTEINAAVNSAESQKLTVASTTASSSASLNAAAQAVQSAEGSLASSERTLESRSAPLRDVDKAVYLAGIASSRANVSLVDQQIADATLDAPSEGIVGSVGIDLGEVAQQNVGVGTLISSELRIESELSELDIAKIRVEQPVAFTFDAIEGRTFAGRVTSIAAREISKNEDIYYLVKIAIDDMEPPIRIGMTADLDIIVGSKEDALLAPRRQVYRREGKDYVKIVAASGKAEEVEVTVGLRGLDDYEILSGVRESDRILVE